MVYDYDKKAFVENEKEVQIKFGFVPDDLAFLIASVAMRPESAQGAYIEILKMMARGEVTTVYHDRHIQEQNESAISRVFKYRGG